MKKIFNKRDVLTVPNLLSLVRLLLIPVIIWLYVGEKNNNAAINVIIISGVTDIIDGFIARRFNVVSDLGKMLDPFADKLTQGAIIICLISKYSLMIPFVILFAVKEVLMGVMGLVVLKKKDSINSARWFGKVNTAVLYIVMSLLILVPNMPLIVANVLIIFCGIIMILALCFYARFYYKLLTDKNKPRGAEKVQCTVKHRG